MLLQKATALHQELKNELKQLRNTTSDTILFYSAAMDCCQKSLKELKTICLAHSWESAAEEISFFKELKPQFTALLIYYRELLLIEKNKPLGTQRQRRAYHKAILHKTQRFLQNNREFYQYMQSGSTQSDQQYFLRKSDTSLFGSFKKGYHFTDTDFSTPGEISQAQILAAKKLIKHLKRKLQKNKKNNPAKLQWTASKVALVELLYALHAQGVINNGNSSLNELTAQFSTIFNIKLSQVSRIFLEIRSRKTISQTSFLDQLTASLTKKIEETDK